MGTSEYRVIVVMGVTASGKTTIGRLLAETLGFEFHDADDFHPEANVTKMRRGEPLSDADRTDWLEALRALIDRAIERGQGLVLACSALKEQYRERLGLPRPGAALVYLRADPELVALRASRRSGHFMPASLIPSQFANLEEPQGAITVDAGQPPAKIVGRVAAVLQASS